MSALERKRKAREETARKEESIVVVVCIAIPIAYWRPKRKKIAKTAFRPKMFPPAAGKKSENKFMSP